MPHARFVLVGHVFARQHGLYARLYSGPVFGVQALYPLLAVGKTFVGVITQHAEVGGAGVPLVGLGDVPIPDAYFCGIGGQPQALSQMYGLGLGRGFLLACPV